jgi:hypothetical protein
MGPLQLARVSQQFHVANLPRKQRAAGGRQSGPNYLYARAYGDRYISRSRSDSLNVPSFG